MLIISHPQAFYWYCVISITATAEFIFVYSPPISESWVAQKALASSRLQSRNAAGQGYKNAPSDEYQSGGLLLFFWIAHPQYFFTEIGLSTAGRAWYNQAGSDDP